MKLVETTYRQTARFPPNERFGISAQIRRAAVSIPSNIAEGAARGSNKEFCRFLKIARGSAAELDTQIRLAVALGYLPDAAAQTSEIDRIARMLSGLIRSLN